MTMDSCNVTLAGWYGAANLGDELLLETFVRWVRQGGGAVRAVSVHPGFTSATHGIPAVPFNDVRRVAAAIADADLLVLGGGGLFQTYDAFDRASLAHFPALNVSQYAQYVLLANELGVDAALLAQGVGPLGHAEARAITAEVFARSVASSVRDAESASLLRSIGVQGELVVAPDPGWTYPRPEPVDLATRFPQLGGRPVLAVTLRNWPFESGWEEAFLDAFRDALPRDWGCLWLDFSRTPAPDGNSIAGGEIAYRLVPRLPERAHAVWQGMRLGEAAALMASCDAVLAMRLHATLLAHLARRPVVALEYDDKVRVLGDEIGLPRTQRLALREIPWRLGPALRAACGLEGATTLIDTVRCEQLARAALRHRDVLWQAMEKARSRRQVRPASTPMLERWLNAER